MKKHIIFHPFLLALAPIFSLLYANIEEISFREAIVPSTVSVAATIIIYFGLKLALKSQIKAGLMASLTVLLFFSYGRAYTQISEAKLLGVIVGRNGYLLFFAAILLLGLRWLKKTDRKLSDFSRVINAFAASWLVLVLVQIGYADLNQHRVKSRVSNMVSPETGDLDTSTNSGQPGRKPDIYYLIFDRYSGTPALADFMDFDNSEFMNYLENTGFYVASDSQSNYTTSQQSISSSLSFLYHKGKNSNTVFYEMLSDYRVWRFLKSRGYSFYHFGSWWARIKENRFADYNFPYDSALSRSRPASRYLADNLLVGTPQTSFTLLLLKTTVFAAASDYEPEAKADKYQPKPKVARNKPKPKADKYSGLRTALLEKFDELGKIPQDGKPKFVFAHMLIPHEPYLFNEFGEPLSPSEGGKIREEENYVNYIKFANKKIRKLIEEIIANSERPPVIIVQADEGYTPTRRFKKEGTKKNRSLWSERSADDLKLHLSILNAYYLPGFDKSKLYKSVSPVNSFRLVFNHYFGTEYPLLKDKTFLYDYKRKKWATIGDEVK